MSRLFPNKYSGKNKRAEHDQYFTPLKPVEALCYLVDKQRPPTVWYPANILDPCAGEGIWGATLKKRYLNSILYGVDIDTSLEKPIGFDHWINRDFLESDYTNKKFDIIISNPPFKYAEKFVHKGLSLLEDYGTLAYLLPLAFLSSMGRYNKLYNVGVNPNKVIVSSRRIDFTGQNNPHTDVAMFIWNKHPLSNYGSSPTILNWFDWEATEILPRTTFGLNTALGQMEIKHE